MGKGLKVLFKILETIICVPLGIVGAVCLTPCALIVMLIGIPMTIIEDIWGINFYPEEDGE